MHAVALKTAAKERKRSIGNRINVLKVVHEQTTATLKVSKVAVVVYIFYILFSKSAISKRISCITLYRKRINVLTTSIYLSYLKSML